MAEGTNECLYLLVLTWGNNECQKGVTGTPDEADEHDLKGQ